MEKPFTLTVGQAEELVELADKKHLKIMVDHTFLFTGAVKKIKELMDAGALGKLYYYDSMRVNLGLFQHDVNVVWDLAPHDLSVMDYLIKEKPVALSATGEVHYNGFEDIAYVTVYCEKNVIAHFNVNWLSPVKVRTTLLGGDKKMLVWNDLEADEKIKLYDKGVEVKNRENVYDLLVSYRSGDAWIPRVDQIEALKLEANYFVDCVTNDKTPINDGHAGLRIVRMLEAASESIKGKGKLVEFQELTGRHPRPPRRYPPTTTGWPTPPPPTSRPPRVGVPAATKGRPTTDHRPADRSTTTVGPLPARRASTSAGPPPAILR